jgi:hypothetical protein
MKAPLKKPYKMANTITPAVSVAGIQHRIVIPQAADDVTSKLKTPK